MRTCQTPLALRGVSAAFVAIFSAAILPAQTPDPLPARYQEAVETYQAGDVNLAVTSLSTLSSAELKTAVAAVSAEEGWPFKKAAAMLHTEVAIRQAGASPIIPQHLGLAETLILTPPTEGQGFAERWYAFAGQFLLAHSIHPDAPRPFIERGFRVSRVNPPLHVLAGILGERLARLNDVESQDREVRRHLEDAEREYRLALDQAPELIEARLRLGRVLFLLGRLRDARESLAAVQSSATDPGILYLAHLFLGAVNQAEEDWAAARADYEAAMALGPEHQTPYIALSFVEQAAGNVARARELAVIVADLQNPPPRDPWWGYPRGAFDLDTLRWLRAEVRP